MRPGPDLDPGSVVRCDTAPCDSPGPDAEPGRGRDHQQRMQRQRAPVLRPEAVEGLDLLARDQRVRRERVVVARPPAPAAGVGQHMGQRLEVDAGRP